MFRANVGAWDAVIEGTRGSKKGRLSAVCYLLIACLVLLLTGCRFPGAVRPTVKIGLVAPFEGRYRYVGYDVVYAVRLAVREANAAGGVGGYSVELVAYDDGADPAAAVEQARKLAVDSAVVAALGHFREETTAAALDIYAQAGLPLIAPASLDPALCRPGADAETLAGALFDRMQEMELERFVLVSDGGLLGAALVEMAQRRQMRPLATVSPHDRHWLTEAVGAEVDAVVCACDPVAAGETAAALRGAGWRGLFLGGPELASADFAAVAGEAGPGALFVTPWPFPRDAADSADFAAAYQEMGPHVEPPGPLALPAYRAARALLGALEQDIAAHGWPTREGASAALAATDLDAALLYWYRIDAQGAPEIAALPLPLRP